MEAVHSFAPLAGRLAAKVAEIRPAAGAKVSWANFMALFFCAIFEMLILLCEALDARAAAEAARLAASPREDVTRPVVAAGPGHGAMPVAGRAPRLALVPDVQAISPQRDAALPGTAASAPTGPRLAWTRHPCPAWAVAGRVAIPPKNAAWRPGIRHAHFVTLT